MVVILIAIFLTVALTDRFFIGILVTSRPAQVSRILLSILADFISVVVCLFSSFPLISNFSCFYPGSCGLFFKGPNYNWYRCQFQVPRYYHFTFCDIFVPALVDGHSLEFEWQHVYSGLQDSSQYSGQSQQICCLNCLDSSSDFQLFKLLFQSFEDRSKCANYNWYHRHHHVSQLF